MTTTGLVTIRPFPLLLLLTVLLAFGCADTLPDPDEGTVTAEEALFFGDDPRGAFSCDLVIDGAFPMGEVPPVIERDRVYMTAQRGFETKFIPIVPDFATGNLFSGGRYLFDRYSDARRYHDWIANDMILDGVKFFERDMFLSSECYHWRVVGVHEITPSEQHTVLRTERFAVPDADRGHINQTLRRRWEALRDEAAARGYGAVWLMYNKREQLIQVVYWTERHPASPPGEFDFAGLTTLQSAPPLGDALDLPATWARVFDRTHWTLTLWYPFEAGDQGEPALWPNSPPLPAPYCGDAVCEVSRGEDADTCATDCPAQCGDAVCQADEDNLSCPGDCDL